MGRMMQTCYEASHGRYVMLMNDDVVFRTPEWDERVAAAFARFPDEIALVYGNDLDQGPRVPSFPIISRLICDLMGGVCPVGYRKLHIESHINDIFRELARLGHDRRLYLEDVVFEHQHPVVGKARFDATYRRQRALIADEQLYFELADERRQLARRLNEWMKLEAPQRVRIPEADRGPGPASHRPPGPTARAEIEPPKGPLAVIERPEFTIVMARRPSNQRGRATTGLAVRTMQIGASDRAGDGSLARAFNSIMASLEEEFLAFLPESAQPGSGWLEAAIDALCRDPALAVVGCKVLHRRSGRVLHAGIGFYESGGLTRFSHLYAGLTADHPTVVRERRCQAVSVVGMVARTRSVIDAGGFDERFQSAGAAGTDLCLRSRQSGAEVLYVPGAVVAYPAQLDAEVTHADARRLHEVWRRRVLLDLGKLLQEDGFRLTSTAGRLTVMPSGEEPAVE